MTQGVETAISGNWTVRPYSPAKHHAELYKIHRAVDRKRGLHYLRSRKAIQRVPLGDALSARRPHVHPVGCSVVRTLTQTRMLRGELNRRVYMAGLRAIPTCASIITQGGEANWPGNIPILEIHPSGQNGNGSENHNHPNQCGRSIASSPNSFRFHL